MYKKQNQFNPTGIKGPTEVDMLLNKTLTQINCSHVNTIVSLDQLDFKKILGEKAK